MADALLAIGRKRRAWRVPRETPRRASSGSVSLTALDSEASAAPARGLGPLTWAVKRFLAAMRHLPAHDAVDPGLGEKDPFSVHSDAPRKRGKKGKLTGRPALADLDGPVLLPFHGHPHPDEVYHAVRAGPAANHPPARAPFPRPRVTRAALSAHPVVASPVPRSASSPLALPGIASRCAASR